MNRIVSVYKAHGRADGRLGSCPTLAVVTVIATVGRRFDIVIVSRDAHGTGQNTKNGDYDHVRSKNPPNADLHTFFSFQLCSNSAHNFFVAKTHYRWKARTWRYPVRRAPAFGVVSFPRRQARQRLCRILWHDESQLQAAFGTAASRLYCARRQVHHLRPCRKKKLWSVTGKGFIFSIKEIAVNP
jgi:hypothetical protein